MQYMKAMLLARSKEVRDDGSIVEVVIRELPVSGGQEPHLFGGEGAAAVCGFGMACAGAVLSTSFS